MAMVSLGCAQEPHDVDGVRNQSAMQKQLAILMQPVKPRKSQNEKQHCSPPP